MAWCSFKAQGQLSPLRAQNRCDTPHCAADLNFGIEISSFTVEWLKKLNRWLVACDSMQSHQRTGNIKQDEETWILGLKFTFFTVVINARTLPFTVEQFRLKIKPAKNLTSHCGTQTLGSWVLISIGTWFSLLSCENRSLAICQSHGQEIFLNVYKIRFNSNAAEYLIKSC